MCIRDSPVLERSRVNRTLIDAVRDLPGVTVRDLYEDYPTPVSYTHLRAHETVLDLVCRLLLENKNHD